MSLKTNRFLSALARGSSSLRIKLRKPLKTKEEGVSPGCTRLLRKNTCKHIHAHRPALSVSVDNWQEVTGWKRVPRVFFFMCACVWVCVTYMHLFANEAVRPRSVSVRKQFGQTRFSLLLHSIAVGHSEQVNPVAIQRLAQQFSVVVQTARFAKSSDRQQAGGTGISGRKG